ncbi:MAG: hypothetical protein M9918_25015 [Anaerolineae bacterium]|nr:hypothetical protein [Anaerolineae bacterium]MCO5195465.1 hypothetical protein [Anaerolineae bacterium]
MSNWIRRINNNLPAAMERVTVEDGIVVKQWSYYANANGNPGQEKDLIGRKFDRKGWAMVQTEESHPMRADGLPIGEERMPEW